MQRIELEFKQRVYHGNLRVENTQFIFNENGELRHFKASVNDGTKYKKLYTSGRYKCSPKSYFNVKCEEMNLQIGVDENLNTRYVIDDHTYNEYSYYPNGYISSIVSYVFLDDGTISRAQANFNHFLNYTTVTKSNKKKEKGKDYYTDDGKLLSAKFTYDNHFKITDVEGIDKIGDNILLFAQNEYDSVVYEDYSHLYFNPCTGSLARMVRDIAFDDSGRFINAVRKKNRYITNFYDRTMDNENVDTSINYIDGYNKFIVSQVFISRSFQPIDFKYEFRKVSINAYSCTIYRNNKKIAFIEKISKNYLGVYDFSKVNTNTFMNNVMYFCDILMDIATNAISYSSTKASIIGDPITSNDDKEFKPTAVCFNVYKSHANAVNEKRNNYLRAEEMRKQEEWRQEQERIRAERLKAEEEERKRRERIYEEERRRRQELERQRVEIVMRKREEERIAKEEKRKKRLEKREILYKIRLDTLIKEVATKEAEERARIRGSKRIRRSINEELINRCKEYLKINDYYFKLIDWDFYGVNPITYDYNYNDILNCLKELDKFKDANQTLILNSLHESHAHYFKSLLIDLRKSCKVTYKTKELYDIKLYTALRFSLSTGEFTSKEAAFEHYSNTFGATKTDFNKAYSKYNSFIEDRNRKKEFEIQKSRSKFARMCIDNHFYFDPLVPNYHWEITGKPVVDAAPGDFTSLLDNELFENDPEWNLDLPYVEECSDTFYDQEVSLNDFTRRCMYYSIREDYERSINSKIERGKFDHV